MKLLLGMHSTIISGFLGMDYKEEDEDAPVSC